MKRRRSTVSSALAFMDCICCAFGAVLLLFILTAKTHRQHQRQLHQVSESTLAELQGTLHETQQAINKIDLALNSTSQDPVPLLELKQANSEKYYLEKAIQATQAQIAALNKQQADDASSSSAPWKKVPADPRFLSDLQIAGPHIAIILESSGSMLGEDVASVLTQLQKAPNKSSKWQRAKSIVRSLIASMPAEQQFALLSMQAQTTPIRQASANDYTEADDGEAIVKMLKRLDQVEPQGGANLTSAMRAIQALNPPPSNVLLIADGLPTAPAPSQSQVSESERVKLFFAAAQLCPDLTFNVLLLPFAGDPSAAGLYWTLCSQKKGMCLVPASNWPSQHERSDP